MKNFIVFFVLATLLSFTACEASQESTDAPTEDFDASIIQGTWEMTHHMPADTNEVIPVDHTVYKIYTKDHFRFIAYNADSISLLGGGTYTITRDSFTENLQFMTMDMTDAPKSLTFSHKIEGNTFAQSGIIPSLGGGEGQNYKLEERYKKVEASIVEPSDHPYVGLWRMMHTQNGDATEVTLIPDSISRMKTITPGHFLIVSWSKNSLMPISAVFGSQKMEDGKYIETVIANTMNAEMNGVTIPYSAEGKNNTFRMYGEMPYNGDIFKLDEQYTRVE